MSALTIAWWVIRGFVLLEFVGGTIWGIRRVAAKRPDGMLCLFGCLLLLCEQSLTLAMNVFGWQPSIELTDGYARAQPILLLLGMFGVAGPYLWDVWDRGADADGKQRVWSRGSLLLAFAMISAVILPLSIEPMGRMLVARELAIAIVIAVLITAPSVVTWMLASHHLQALRRQGGVSKQRPITLFAYGISSVGSLAGFFLTLLLFLALAKTNGWIE